MTRLEYHLIGIYLEHSGALISRNMLGDYVVETPEDTIVYRKKQDMLLDILYTLTQWAELEGDAVTELLRSLKGGEIQCAK